MLRENKSEKQGQCILYSTVTAKPEVRWPLIIKCFVCERACDKVESNCAVCSLVLKFILILRQETKIRKKNKPYLTMYDICLLSCTLVQFKVKELQQNLFIAHGVKTVEHLYSDQIGRERLVQLYSKQFKGHY